MSEKNAGNDPAYPVIGAPGAQQVATPSAVVWCPIETAPKDNKRPLYLAQFNDAGELIEIDWDASWEAESESWEMPQVYYIWRSANGRVDEPTHWAYQDAQQPVREEMSPDFTDSARAAIAWVLYHHQGGSSPVGQPLRFALGMGAHEPLPDWRIAEAKAWAEWAKATTADFHAQQPAVVGDGVDLQQFRQAVVHWYADADNANTNPEWTRGEAERLLAIIDAQAALTPAATPGDGTVSASDWRDLYRLQTAMRYMDCDAGLTRETAYSMADADIGRIEALAQKEGNGNG